MKIEEILLEFPELNRRWLLTGEGEMLNSQPIEQHVENGNNISQFGDVISLPEEIINKFLEEIAAQRKTLERTQEQVTAAQEQITRLISIIERR
jgi:CRISPR/Cas system CSM-associated protein Csm2 small subunit